MAMMARVVGIPSRVAVGFLPGERARATPGRCPSATCTPGRSCTSPGYGWVRFEPTPASVTGTAPAWTLPQSDSPSDQESAGQRAAVDGGVDASPLAPTDADHDRPHGCRAPGRDSAWQQALIGAGIGLLVLLVLAAPATIRFRRRSARLAGEGAPEDQVEDGLGRAPRLGHRLRRKLAGRLPADDRLELGHQLDAEESAAIGRVAVLVERGRYARSLDGSGLDDLPAMTQQIRRGLAPTSRWRRIRATLLPKSLLNRPKV